MENKKITDEIELQENFNNDSIEDLNDEDTIIENIELIEEVDEDENENK